MELKQQLKQKKTNWNEKKEEGNSNQRKQERQGTS